MVSVSDVEHRGTVPALELPQGQMLEELMQLGTMKVSMPHCGTKLCLAMYQLFRKPLMRVSDEWNDAMAILVGQPEGSLLWFTLTGEEHVDAPLVTCKTCKWSVPLSSESMLSRCGVCGRDCG